MTATMVQANGDTLVAMIDLDIYGLEPLQKVAHKFTGLCYVLLEQETKTRIICRFRRKDGQAFGEDLVGQFLNEVLDQTLARSSPRGPNRSAASFSPRHFPRQAYSTPSWIPRYQPRIPSASRSQTLRTPEPCNAGSRIPAGLY
jgi:hypothetical protein